MAKNRVYTTGQYLGLVCSYPATPDSGDPVLVGAMPGVAETDEGTDGVTSVDLGPAVYSLPVTASAGAIALGDRIFATQASPVVLSNDPTGVPFGFALTAVGGGQTATINVKHGAVGASGLSGDAIMTVRSKVFDIDIGAGTTDDDVMLRPARNIVVVASRIVYDEATAAAGATAATIQAGTAVAGAQIVAATAIEQPKAIGATTAAAVVGTGAVAAGTPIIARLTGVVATPIVGKAHLELDYRLA